MSLANAPRDDVSDVRARPLENRRYAIIEFIDNGWL